MKKSILSFLITICLVSAAVALVLPLSLCAQSVTEDILPEGGFESTPWRSSLGYVVTPTLPPDAVLTNVFATLSGGAEVSEYFSTPGFHDVSGTFTLELLQNGTPLPGGSVVFSASGEGYGAGNAVGFGNPTPINIQLPLSLNQAPLTIIASGVGNDPMSSADGEVTFDFAIVPEPTGTMLGMMSLIFLVAGLTISKRNRRHA